MTKVFPLEGYEASKVLEETENSKHYIASSKEREGIFLISEFYDRDSINLFLSDFVCLSQNKVSELVECFSQNSVFYVVFKYTKATALLKHLEQEKLGFDHRVSIARAIILKVRELCNAPLVIQRAVLSPLNIVIDEGGIFFNFQMDLYSMKAFKDRTIYYEVGELLTELFTYKEIEKNSRLKVILGKCQKDIYESLGEVIRDFDSLLKEEAEVLNLKAVAAEKLKQFARTKRSLLVAASILIVVIALYNVYVANVNNDVVVFAPISEIGTVSITEKESLDYIAWDNSNKTIYIYDRAYEQVTPTQKPNVEVTPSADVEKPPLPQQDDNEPEEDLIPKDIVYIVKPGDSLYTICKGYYGNPYEYLRVAEYNDLSNLRLILPKQVILLPPPVTD